MGRRSRWVMLGFAVGVVAVGAGYWGVPYREVRLPTSLPRGGLIATGLVTLALCWSGAAKLPVAVPVMAASVGAAVLARAGVEVAVDPTSHNLWPLEVVLSSGMGLLYAAGGGVLGSLPRWLGAHRRSSAARPPR